MKPWILAAAALGVAACCSAKPAPLADERVAPPPAASAPSTPAAPAPPPAGPRFELAGKTYTLGEDHPFPSCEAPERWLAYVEPEGFLEAYCRRCSSSFCSPDSGDESGGPWSFARAAHGDEDDGFWCNERQYVRHAIGAELGVAAPSGRLARHFGQQRWYSPQPAAKEAELPEAARRNMAWLDGLIDRCERAPTRPSAALQKLVDDWFDANYAGSAPLPGKLYRNCEPIGAGEFRAMARAPDHLRYSARTPVHSTTASCAEMIVPPGGRVIAVHVGAWLTGEPCQECEGHETVEFVVDRRGKIVAIGAAMSG
jgi:hypothetical protein